MSMQKRRERAFNWNLREICAFGENNKPNGIPWVLEAIKIFFDNRGIHFPPSVEHKELEHIKRPPKER